MAKVVEVVRSAEESVRNAQWALEEAMKLDADESVKGGFGARIEACEAAVLALEGADADGDEAAMDRAIAESANAASGALVAASTMIRYARSAKAWREAMAEVGAA